MLDFTKFAEPFREIIMENAERLTAENGLEIEFVGKPKSFRKEDRIAEIINSFGGSLIVIHSAAV